MICEFAAANHVVGIKQSSRAVTDGSAKKAFAACDADPQIVDTFVRLCEDNGVEIERDCTMEELGKACGINVGAACAVILK